MRIITNYGEPKEIHLILYKADEYVFKELVKSGVPVEVYKSGVAVSSNANRIKEKGRDPSDYIHHQSTHLHKLRAKLAGPLKGVDITITSTELSAEIVKWVGLEPIPELHKKEKTAKAVNKLVMSD